MDNDITLNRKIQKWGWYKDANTMRVFIHLLLNANWHDGEYCGYPVLRGQCIFGYEAFSNALGISVRSVRTALNHLKTTGEVTSKTTNRFSVITIVKYSDYQPLKDKYEQDVNFEIMNEKTTGKTTGHELPTNGLGTQYNSDGNNACDKQNDIKSVTQVTSKRQATDSIQEVKKERNKEVKELYGEFSNVKLTIEEYEKLLTSLGNQTQSYIDRLDGYIASKGVKYKSHYATILNWWRKDGMQGKPAEKKKSSFLDL